LGSARVKSIRTSVSPHFVSHGFARQWLWGRTENRQGTKLLVEWLDPLIVAGRPFSLLVWFEYSMRTVDPPFILGAYGLLGTIALRPAGFSSNADSRSAKCGADGGGLGQG
jgi:hypothetical protein